jgi:hypothetical protein
MPTVDPGRADAVHALQAAADAIVRCAPPGFTRDVTDILRRTGLMIAALEKHDITVTCDGCGRPFTFASRRAQAVGVPPRCFPCREEQRSEISRLRSANG